jgi:Fe/S biogenesis protein NfuA
VDAASVRFLDGAEIDYEHRATGGQLQIRAPKIKGEAPDASASLVEQVQWLIEHEINPQLAMHRGNVALQEVTRDGIVVLRFGGGCHGCGMVDVTLKQGIEKTLLARVPGVTAVRDSTDHDSGQAPYMPRGSA